MIWGRYACQLFDLLAAKLDVYGLETSSVSLISPTENSTLKLIATIARQCLASKPVLPQTSHMESFETKFNGV